MFACVANRFWSAQATVVAGTVPIAVIELTTVLATVAVTDPVTAVDTEDIGATLKAGAPELAILAKT